MPATGARVEVEGAKELRRALKRMGDDLKDLRAINLEAANAVADRARERVPVVSGRLQRSIKPRATKTRGYVTAGDNRLVPYAGPIHFGWSARNIAPQPFLFDALDDRRDEIVRKYQDRVSGLVERVGRETP
jgi:hypothetical protein